MKRKVVMFFLLLSVAAVVFGCGTAGGGLDSPETEGAASQEAPEGQEDAGYRTSFTESEIAEGRASFQAAENLYVDAEITPAEKYEDGVNSYYMVQHYEEGEVDGELTDASGLAAFGRTQEEFLGTLSTLTGIEADPEMFENSATERKAYWNGFVSGTDNGLDYLFFMSWGFGDGIFEAHAYYPDFYAMVTEDANIAVAEFYAETVGMMTMPDTDGLSFADPDEEATALKGIIEQLVGRELSDTFDCISVTPEKAEAINAAYPELELETGFDGYYQYYFYYDLDGFPIERLGLSYELKDGESCTAGARYSSEENGSVLYALNECTQQVAYGEDGILFLMIDNYRDKGEVYKEGLEVLSPNTVLASVERYYESTLLTNDVIVTQVRLVYSGYFTDGEDGDVDNAFCPFWKVQAYEGSSGMNVMFAYDAVTGNAVVEGEQVVSK